MTRKELCQAFGFEKHTKKYSTYFPINHKIYHRQVEEYEKRTTIFDNLVKLQKRKLVEKFSMNNGKRGRPLVYWKIIAENQKEIPNEKQKEKPKENQCDVEGNG